MRAAIYARYSSHSQRDESIEDQVRVCTREAMAAGDSVVEVYADHAVSGTSTEGRDEFRRMVRDAERGGFERLWVYKLDRFARDRFDSAVYKARLRKHGVTVMSACERIPDGPDGILLESVLEGLNEYYSANLAQNIRRGMEGNALKCMANGVVVYGYDIGPDGRYVVNEEQAAVVRRVFAEAAAGRAMADICRDLPHALTPRGRPFSVGYVSKMLRRDKYIGVYRFGDHATPGGMPAIVDMETWGRVQARLTCGRRQRQERMGYPLTGKLVDVGGHTFGGHCGTSKTGRSYRYYHCYPTGASVPADDLEREVARAVACALSPEARSRVADAVLAAQDRVGQEEYDEARALEARVQELGREQDRLIDLAAKTSASDRVAARIDELAREEAQARQALASARRSAPLVTRDMVDYWLRRKCAELDAGALASSLVARVVLDLDCSHAIVDFVVLETEKVELPDKDIWEFDSSPLVDQSASGANSPIYDIVPRRLGFGVLFSPRRP